jgi:hypothetical protein
MNLLSSNNQPYENEINNLLLKFSMGESFLVRYQVIGIILPEICFVLIPVGAGVAHSVSVVSDYRLDDQDSIPGRGKGFFFWHVYPDLL